MQSFEQTTHFLFQSKENKQSYLFQELGWLVLGLSICFIYLQIKSKYDTSDILMALLINDSETESLILKHQ